MRGGEIISRILVRCGGLLLLLTSLALVVMPWTEYFWHFDRFLQGGQDFELNIIAVMSVLCLALLLLLQGRRCVAAFLWLCRLLGFLRQADDPVTLQAAYDQNLIRNAPPLPMSALALYTQPIQV